MVKLSRLASLLKRSGRREFRAQRWDATADHCAERRAFWVGQWQGLEYMFQANQAEEARITAEEFWLAETKAREVATAIREGKR